MSTVSRKLSILLLLTLAIIGGFLLVPPFEQPRWYHDFADTRTVFNIPNAWNVLSNFPFVIVGVWGLAFLASSRGRQMETWFFAPAERWPYLIFFVGLALTGVGSAYYHRRPDNDALVWDRMPLAVAFMALFAAVIGERINLKLGLTLLAPLVILGAGSVIYWHWTETRGAGDLRPYLFVQFFPIMALPLLIYLFPAKYTRTSDLWAALGLYALAKVLELLDKTIYSAGAIVSGHTLKHFVAGASCYMVLHVIRWRRAV